MTTEISHLKLRVTVPEKPPPKMIETYIKGAMDSPDKGYKRLKEVIPDIDAVIEKIIKPGVDRTKDWLNPKYVPKHGRKPPPNREDMERQARRWLKKMKHAYRDKGKEHAEVMKYMAEIWGEKMLPNLAITGYQDEIRGVGPVTSCWLTGDGSVLPLIHPKEIILGPQVDITKPGQGGIFRKRFNSLILSVGKPIIVNKNQPDYIKEGNEQINRLVTAFASNKFVSFTPGGASRVDFIMAERQLFLEIVVSVH